MVRENPSTIVVCDSAVAPEFRGRAGRAPTELSDSDPENEILSVTRLFMAAHVSDLRDPVQVRSPGCFGDRGRILSGSRRTSLLVFFGPAVRRVLSGECQKGIVSPEVFRAAFGAPGLAEGPNVSGVSVFAFSGSGPSSGRPEPEPSHHLTFCYTLSLALPPDAR